jgi:hypothetical protein
MLRVSFCVRTFYAEIVLSLVVIMLCAFTVKAIYSGDAQQLTAGKSIESFWEGFNTKLATRTKFKLYFRVVSRYSMLNFELLRTPSREWLTFSVQRLTVETCKLVVVVPEIVNLRN